MQYTFVRAQQDVETLLGEPQELAVLLTGPSRFRHRNDFMNFGEISFQATVHILIQEYAQLRNPNRFAYRPSEVDARVASAISRVVSR